MRTFKEVCEAKQKFESKAEAKQTAVAIKKRNGKPLEPYKCDNCDGWHLTSLVHKQR